MQKCPKKGGAAIQKGQDKNVGGKNLERTVTTYDGRKAYLEEVGGTASARRSADRGVVARKGPVIYRCCWKKTRRGATLNIQN